MVLEPSDVKTLQIKAHHFVTLTFLMIILGKQLDASVYMLKCYTRTGLILAVLSGVRIDGFFWDK